MEVIDPCTDCTLWPKFVRYGSDFIGVEVGHRFHNASLFEARRIHHSQVPIKRPADQSGTLNTIDEVRGRPRDPAASPTKVEPVKARQADTNEDCLIVGRTPTFELIEVETSAAALRRLGILRLRGKAGREQCRGKNAPDEPQ